MSRKFDYTGNMVIPVGLDDGDLEVWSDLDCVTGVQQGYQDCVSGRIVEAPNSFWTEADKLIEND